VIGIDQGITLLSAENLRSDKVWRWYVGNADVTRALDAADLTEERIRRRACLTEPRTAVSGLELKDHRLTCC
jgi:hypothetical protein